MSVWNWQGTNNDKRKNKTITCVLKKKRSNAQGYQHYCLGNFVFWRVISCQELLLKLIYAAWLGSNFNQ